MAINHKLENPMTHEKEINWMKILFAIVLIIVVLSLGIIIGSSIYTSSNQSNLSTNNIPTPPTTATNAAKDLGPQNSTLNFSSKYPQSQQGSLSFLVTDPTPTGGAVPSNTATPPKGLTKPVLTTVTPGSLNITIPKVEVQMNSSKFGKVPTEYSGWETLNNTASSPINLLALSSGTKSINLGTTNLLAGTYNAIKIFISKVTATVNGANVSVNLPPNDFIMVTHNIVVNPSSAVSVTVAFDASKMLQESNGSYYFIPKIINIKVG